MRSASHQCWRTLTFRRNWYNKCRCSNSSSL